MSGPTLTSTTSTQEEMEHALGPDWRDPSALKPPPSEPAANTEGIPSEGEKTPPVTPAATETADDSGTEEATNGRKPGSLPRGVQKRIDKITKNWRSEQTRADAAEKRAAELESKVNSTPKSDTVSSDEPQLDDFLSAGKTPQEWAAHYNAWQEAHERRKEVQRRNSEATEAFSEAVNMAVEKDAELRQLMAENDDFSIYLEVGDAIKELGKDGVPIFKYLLSHPEIADEMSAMTPKRAVMRLQPILDSFAKPSPTDKPKPKPAPPEPIETVGTSATRSSVPLDQLPPREFNRIRDKQERERKGR